MMSDAQRGIEIVDFIHGKEMISKRQFRSWWRSDDPDVLGAAYFAAASHWSRVEGGVARSEFGSLLSCVFESALKGRGATRFSLSNYQAARTFMGWMMECYKDRQADVEAERCLKWAARTLATLYKRGTRDARRCIVDGALEHMFEHEGVVPYFKAWKSDRVLAKGYREAMEWARSQSDNGGAAEGVTR
jgi:hypothetical protein